MKSSTKTAVELWAFCLARCDYWPYKNLYHMINAADYGSMMDQNQFYPKWTELFYQMKGRNFRSSIYQNSHLQEFSLLIITRYGFHSCYVSFLATIWLLYCLLSCIQARYVLILKFESKVIFLYSISSIDSLITYLPVKCPIQSHWLGCGCKYICIRKSKKNGTGKYYRRN